MTRLVILTLLLAPLAIADDKADAEAEMMKAQENLERGEFEFAISRFNLARSLVPSSSGPYLGLGMAYARSGRCEQAVPYLEEYLRRKKQNPKPEATETLADCKRRSVRPTGRITVTSEPSGAEVRFDDVQGPIVGTTPFESQPMPPGRHRVFVAKSGFRGASSDVVVNAGERATFTVALVPTAAPPPATSADPVVAPPRIIIEAPPVPPEPPKPPEKPGKLIIDVAPEAAKLTVNGTVVAASTRHYEGSHPPGSYNVLAERQGYRDVATSMKLVPDGSDQRELKLPPLKKPLWLGVGIGFTLVAVAMGGGALGTYLIANEKPRDTADYETNKTASLAMQGLFYPTLAVAAVGYVLWGVLNRGRVADGPPLRVQATPAGFKVRF
jgi:hypothetical protein